MAPLMIKTTIMQLIAHTLDNGILPMILFKIIELISKQNARKNTKTRFDESLIINEEKALSPLNIDRLSDLPALDMLLVDT